MLCAWFIAILGARAVGFAIAGECERSGEIRLIRLLVLAENGFHGLEHLDELAAHGLDECFAPFHLSLRLQHPVHLDFLNLVNSMSFWTR